MKRIWIFLLLIPLFVAACGKDDNDTTEPTEPQQSAQPSGTSETSSQTSHLQEIQQSGKLVIGTAITRPFEYRDANNELIGFDVSLMEAIAERLDVEIEWREMAFADLLNELQAGNVDLVIAGMYITPAREELIDFSQPYLNTGLVMVVHDGVTDVNTFEDLKGHLVGVKEGSTGERWAEQLRSEQGIEFELRRYADTLSSLDDLAAQQIDVVFNDRINSLEYMKTHPNVRIQGDIFDPAGLGISVQSGDAELLAFINTALAEMQAEGEIDRFFDEWINPETAG